MTREYSEEETPIADTVNGEPPALTGYRFTRLLGQGGMGTVHLAWDETLDRQVAIKTLADCWEPGSTAESRFRREARAMATIEHPNVVRLYSFNIESGRAFIVMEYIEGDTLARRLRERGELGVTEALLIIRQVAEALEAARQKRVIHRDIKPSNILLDRRGRVHVADFGLAKLVRDQDGDTSALTRGGTLQGTPHYMSPEQAAGEKVDWRCDLYSLGVVLYEMLTGERPFTGTLLEIAASHLERSLPPLALRKPHLPPGVQDLVTWLTQKKPSDRPASYREVLEMVEAIIGPATASGSVSWPPASSLSLRRRIWRRPPSWLRLTAAGVGVALAAAVAGWWYRGAEKAPAPTASAGTGVRPAVAVLGFKNLSGRPEHAWLSTALAEMLTAELTAGGQLRTIAAENLARARIELSLPQGETLGAETLRKVRAVLGADLVVIGSYLAVPGDRNALRLDLHLQDAVTGGISTFTDTATVDAILDIVTRMGIRMRQALDLTGVPPATTGRTLAAVPADRTALRCYAEGLQCLRSYQYLAAKELLTQAVDADPGNPLVHAALAEMWGILGHDSKARSEAAIAVTLAEDLSREDRLFVEARNHVAAKQFGKAVKSYQNLYASFPDNVEYGLRLAQAQTGSGDPTGALATIESLRRLPPPASRDIRIALAEAEAALLLSSYRQVLEVSTAAIEQGQAEGARLLVARALLDRATAHNRLGRSGEAAEDAEKARQIFAAVGDHSNEAWALTRIAAIAREDGDYRAARRIFEDTLRIWMEVGNLRGISVALNNIAHTLVFQGRLAEAKPFLQEAVEVANEQGNQGWAGLMRIDLADLTFRQGEIATAAATAREGLELTRTAAYRHGSNVGLYVLGKICTEMADTECAATSLEEGLQLAIECGEQRYQANLLSCLGTLAALADDGQLARHHHQMALDIHEAQGRLVEKGESQVALTLLAVQQRQADADTTGVREAISVFRARDLSEAEGTAWAALSALSLTQGRTTAAVQACERAEQLLEKCETVPVRLRIALQLARCQQTSGNQAQARELLAKTNSEAARLGFVLIELEAGLELALLESDRQALSLLAERAGKKQLRAIARRATQAATGSSQL